MMGHTGTHAINATLYSDLVRSDQDFAPVSPDPFNNILIVPKDSPATSAKELVALAKSAGRVERGSQGVGTGGHLPGVLPAAGRAPRWCTCRTGVAPAATDTVAGRLI